MGRGRVRLWLDSLILRVPPTEMTLWKQEFLLWYVDGQQNHQIEDRWIDGWKLEDT